VFVWEESFTIEDFSTNGTTLNGIKLVKGEKKELKNGDEIGIVVINDEKTGKGVLKVGYIFRDTN
jgi:pSer/pThr/pTyr-binding forkhead associated (FHA) protein